jgi:hypothetical protein
MTLPTSDLVTEILQYMAKEKNKSLTRMTKLLVITQNQGVLHRFWEILDERYPNHNYKHLTCCQDCGMIELSQQ